MKKIICKIGLVFVIVIVVTETSFIPLTEAQGQYEENIPVYRALFISPYYGSGSPGEIFKYGFTLLEDAFIANGWNQSNIKKLYGLPDGEDITWDIIDTSIKEIGENDTEYDTTLIAIGSHGSNHGFYTYNYNEFIPYTELNKSLCNLDSTVGLIINACYSGSALENYSNLTVDGRVIMTSTNATKGDWPTYITRASFGFDSFADYCIGDDPDNPIGDGNGAVSMKEVYDYIKYNYYSENNSLFWSGYPIITQNQYYPLHIIFQNFTDGKIDQITSDTSDSTSNTYICKDNATGWDRRVAQEFQPSMEKISKVRICLFPVSSGINSTIRVSIQGVATNGTPDGTDLVYTDVLRSEIPEYTTYVSFNFPNDYPLDTEESYFIVIRTIQSDQGKYNIKYYNHDYYPVTPGYNYSYWYYDNGSWTENSEYDVQFVTYGKNSNMPPHTPIRPFGGPKEGYANVSYDFNVTTTDIDKDKVAYGLHWDGDDVKWYNNTGNYYDSGDIVKVNYTWETAGQKFINVTAKDIHGNQGGWSDVWFVNILPNKSPNAPTITGPTFGGRGKYYNYTLNSTDPDGDDVKYFIDWGDSNNESTDYNGSGEEVIVKHYWEKKGTYTIKAKAVDTHGAESEWATLEVTMNCNVFGYTSSGVHGQNIKNKITGSHFTILANGTADNITAHIQTNLSPPSKTKCVIYRKDDSKLIGTTEEKILNTGENGAWVTYNFSDKTTLARDTEYILACLSNDTCNLSYSNITFDRGQYKNHTYEFELATYINWTSNESRNYSIFCRYTTIPDITNVYTTPNTVGFGYNVTIGADIDDNGGEIDYTTVNITYPNNATGNFTMDNTGNNTYEYVFSDTWMVGQYNFTIWAVDKSGSSNSSSEYSFNVSAQATISVCTVQDDYGNNTVVNITDPPCNPSEIGYELLDEGKVLHIWNKYDSYYFDTSSGIQLTNHYNEYWSHNVLMLGYYNNDVWNLIYRTDELSGFNKNLETDDTSFVNATLWKDLTYGGYDFRLAIRYHIGVNDNELTIIPYIKNIDDQDIPYNLGFAWEINDIQIDMTTSGDYIEINGITNFLNEDLDETYKNMAIPAFYIREDKTNYESESLSLRWNASLDYLVKVKSRNGEYNAPVTLAIKIGTLDAGQEKYTSLFWHDASEVVYYFNSYNNSEAWVNNPGYMVDGNTSNYASTTVDGDIELCDDNNCSEGDIGTISKVEIRVCSYYTGFPSDTILRPVFNGTTDGTDYTYQTPPDLGDPVWSPWFDITSDPSAPQTWSWGDIQGLDCDVEAGPGMPGFTLYCSEIEVRVTYTPYTPPEISNPYPSDGSTGITITPILNITVSDAGGDSMNITWLSNSRGSWQIFGTNNSVGNGTYHQTFSNATENGKWWYWKVNVTDGTNHTESSVYKFYTGYESKIVNTGSTHIKGFLLMQVQYYNGSAWIVADNTVNETTPRTILWEDPAGEPGQNILGLDTIFNGLVNTSNLSGFGNGTYRIYAAFRDPDGNILKCDDETELVASYEFEITF